MMIIQKLIKRNVLYRNRLLYQNQFQVLVRKYSFLIINKYFLRFLIVRTIKTAIGKVPVDSECVSMSDKAHVYCDNNDVFDCMLNQVKKFS